MQNFAEMSSIGKQKTNRYRYVFPGWHFRTSWRKTWISLEERTRVSIPIFWRNSRNALRIRRRIPPRNWRVRNTVCRVSNNFSITIFRLYLYSYIFKACGRRNTVYGNVRAKTRIVGGVESAPGDWPFLAALLGGPEQIFYCAGVLIADQWVLTASHCVGK